MKEIWFKRKDYGFGWVPCTRQGWLVLAIYLLVVFGNILQVDMHSHSVSDTLIGSLLFTIVATIILFGVCLLMGESPRWSWPDSSKNRVSKKIHTKKTTRKKKRTRR